MNDMWFEIKTYAIWFPIPVPPHNNFVGIGGYDIGFQMDHPFTQREHVPWHYASSVLDGVKDCQMASFILYDHYAGLA
jgi:hypothetical protein